MASQPLEIVRAELSASPREHEYLDLGNIDSWSAADKQGAADELMRAAEEGDARVPAALLGLLPPQQLLHSWEYLLSNAPPDVAVEAGWQLLEKGPRSFASAPFIAALRDGQIVGHAETRAVDLLIAAKDQKALRDLLASTAHEAVRSKIIERLFERGDLAAFPTAMWKGLGLVRWQLSLPFASFRQPLLPTLTALLSGASPTALGFSATADPMPPELQTAIADVDSGRGAIPDAILAPLDADERTALLVYAVDEALRSQNPRTLAYVAKLGGGAHDDVLTWATVQSNAAFAQAARDLLAAKP
jgi:hypothetical protein